MNYLSFGAFVVAMWPQNEEKVEGKTNIIQSLCGSYIEKNLSNIAIQKSRFC